MITSGAPSVRWTKRKSKEKEEEKERERDKGKKKKSRKSSALLRPDDLIFARRVARESMGIKVNDRQGCNDGEETKSRRRSCRLVLRESHYRPLPVRLNGAVN